MKRRLPLLGAVALVAAIIGYVVWQRPAPPTPPPPPPKEIVIQYADGSRLWASTDGRPRGPIVKRVLEELHAANLPLDALKLAGGVVRTTVDAKTQSVSATVVGRLVAPYQRLGATVTAIDPASGGVRAYVPGPTRDVYVDLADEPHGTVPAVAEPFTLAGAPGLVQARMRPLDVTAGFAALAAGGVQRKVHFVATVTSADGSLLYKGSDAEKHVFGKDAADRVTSALKEKPGCNGVACVPDAFPWAVGYTPQLAVTVLVDQTGGDVDAGLSVAIWQELVAELTD